MTVDHFVAPPCAEQIRRLYQDESILLIDKPSGLLSLSGKNPANLDSVHYRLVQDYPECTLLHRLDFGTSGIMLVALNKRVNAVLAEQFKARTVGKGYIAILAGHVAKDQGCIELAIAKGTFPRMRVGDSGKSAVSRFEVLERLDSPARSRVRFTPLTGRTHQLRVHSAAMGHPILGCDLYSPEPVTAMADRLMLHAESITFHHPSSGGQVTLRSPAPF